MGVVLELVLLIAGLAMIGFGAWLIAKSKLPAWLKGIWKWPLGDNLTPTVARLLGWANVMAGAACLPTLVLLVLWDRSSSAWIASMVAMLFVGAASFALVWCLALSRMNPAQGEESH